MPDELTMQDMMELQQRIQDARKGEGDMPSREELLNCFSQLRKGRAAASTNSKKGKVAAAAAALPTDLNDLFKPPAA